LHGLPLRDGILSVSVEAPKGQNYKLVVEDHTDEQKGETDQLEGCEFLIIVVFLLLRVPSDGHYHEVQPDDWDACTFNG
jgi:hypothetical protein